jgi:23S rRNA pseudouridine1911/1915/1917 synthase
MKIVESHIVPDNNPGTILDRYALDVFGSRYTRKFLRKAIRRGFLIVNGEPSDPLYRVSRGNRLDILEKGTDTIKKFKLELKVLYEDSSLAVMEKPPGFPVNGNRFRTIEHALPGNLERSDKKGALMVPKPVHRLDSSTGGLLLVAKTSGALSNLALQFQEKRITKTYHALLSGRLASNTGAASISSYISSTSTSRLCMKKRYAETEYRALEECRSLKSGYITLVELNPLTGREHQLRIHMKELGCPVTGDPLYGEEGKTLKGKGLFLWATGIAFDHPDSGERIRVAVDLPPKFKKHMEREQRRWEKYNR